MAELLLEQVGTYWTGRATGLQPGECRRAELGSFFGLEKADQKLYAPGPRTEGSRCGHRAWFFGPDHGRMEPLCHGGGLHPGHDRTGTGKRCAVRA